MHVGIIMDGNGRWARARNLNRQAGHRAGARAVDAVVRAAAGHGITTLTLYAFSADNWHRSGPEVQALLGLLRRYLITETERCVSESIRLNVIGRRDRLPEELVQQIEQSEAMTRACSGMHLRLAIDYSSRHSILAAAECLARDRRAAGRTFQQLLAEVDHSCLPAPAVDLLVRTGGEQRLSDFLLWECAYAELLFVACPWPDFDAAELALALNEYSHRQRRFGRVSAQHACTADGGCEPG